jgi:hypothetical protein
MAADQNGAADGGEEPLQELSLARHRDLQGRRWSLGIWLHRAVVAVLVVFVALAATNQFGQQPEAHEAVAAAASLRVSTPERLRGGLIYQTRIDVTARQPIAHPMITLGGGWFDGMTLNSVQPGPDAQAGAVGGAVSFTYPALQAGQSLSVYFEWSVNPTTVAWQRDLPVMVADGSRTLVSQSSTLTVFP